MARPSGVARAILLSLERLFKLDNVTHIASVELWVLLTTLLLVVRFLIDFKGPWFGNPRRTFVVLTLETLNQNMVIYTMGLMQLSGSGTRKVNDYFQVWAVLLVTLQYSVKIGRPYTRSKQVPLLDLMSFWSANLLRVQTFYHLRIPLWTIWSLNAVRIIFLFVSSGKGETNNQESLRLVSDYMSYEDTLSTLDEQEQGQGQGEGQKKKSVMTMSGYKYLVYGEHRVLKQVHKGSSSSSSSSYKIQLYPDGVHKEQLITVETIWKDKNGSGLLAGEAAEHRRDLCLSFALYKLLRRRFYDLKMHEMDQEAGKMKMRRLIIDYVLDPEKKRERAFRITGEELSFLRDLFYSKHATVFAGGLWVPLQSLLLSLCLAMATGYMLEIVLYLWSRWAKVLLLCIYAQLWHRRPVVEAAMRWFVLCFRAFSSCMLSCFCFCCKAKQMTVRQQNLLVKSFLVLRPAPIPLLPMRLVRLRGEITGTADLEDYIKDAILDQFKTLDLGKEGISIHFSNAFGSKSEVEWPCNPKAVDTHIILVSHIATSLCEIEFSDEKVKELSAAAQIPRPFLRRSRTRRPNR